MNMKKIISGVMAAAIVASMASISAFAAPATFDVVDGDGKTVKGFTSGHTTTEISGDQVLPNSEFFVFLGLTAGSVKAITSDTLTFGRAAFTSDVGVRDVLLNELVDGDNFKFSTDKDDNAKMIKSVSLYTEKSINSSGRGQWIKVVLNDSTTTSEMKLTGTMEFKARNSKVSGKKPGSDTTSTSTSVWFAGDKIEIPYTIWMNNTEKKGSDESADTGDRVVFKPTPNEVNTFVWGDDYAALYFNANDDPNKFYARLDTKNDSNIYAEYGDPVGADLWFYNFVSNAQVPSTSQAVLTLGIPWDEDNDIVPNPADCFIYEKDADGVLTDVTDKFTYSDDNDGTTGIAGWTIKTRTLGSYILSDTELDIVNYDDTDEPTTDAPTTDAPVKDIPNTGSSDMVNVAVVAAVVSLAAAGAVAFRKVK